MKRSLFVTLLFLVSIYSNAQNAVPAFRNTQLPLQTRVNDLLLQLSLAGENLIAGL